MNKNKSLGNGIKDFFRKLGLVLWKNLLLRKNQYVLAIFEIIFPIIGFLIILSLSVMIIPDISDDPQPKDPFEYQFVNWNEPNWPKSWCHRISEWNPTMPLDQSQHSFIAYTPNTPEFTDVIKEVAGDICPPEYDGKKKHIVGWLGVDNEDILEEKYAKTWNANPKFQAAVVFKRHGNGDISYKIRMHPSRFPSIKKILPEKGDSDFRRQGPNEDNSKRYKKSGFLALQLNIDKALTRALVKKNFRHKVLLKPFPYPSYTKNELIGVADHLFKYELLQGLYLFYAWGMCFMIPSITRNVVGEKETGISELLRLTGVSSTIQWLGWLVHVLTPQLLVITLLTLIVFSPVVLDRAILILADPFLFWVILFLYALAAASFGFFVCSLCQKPTIATTVVQLFWVITLSAGAFVIAVPDKVPEPAKLCLSIFPNFALALLIYNAKQLEVQMIDESDEPKGLKWSVLHEIAPMTTLKGEYIGPGVSTLVILSILFAEILVYFGLALYLECVLPSEHGVKRPWYLFNFRGSGKNKVPVVPEQRISTLVPEIAGPEPEPDVDEVDQQNTEANGGGGGGGDEVKTRAGTEDAGPDDKAPEEEKVPEGLHNGFEVEPTGATVGVNIQDLYKQFGRYKVAVNGVSLRMFSGDIFALLGHNGAGKTTLISMLTGFFAPTAGTAIINGYDIRTDMVKARENMGLCPQHNMIFDWLTVSQQVTLFGLLRGLSLEKAKAETHVLLAAMQFEDKSQVLAKKLSGGQKRKLCLAMALIGGTKVVVLDEPTSGMDPQARREIWDLLLQLRGERTILLTTHFMEEADVLGDRIGIMANGQLQCCGTAAFLKKYYGTGYTLKLTLNGEPEPEKPKDEVDVKLDDQAPPPEVQESIVTSSYKPSPAAEAILTAVQIHVPDATFKQDARIDQASHEVFITLPSQTSTTAVLSNLFVDLSGQKEKLGIQTIGLSQTTMDEVFVKVGSVADEEKHGGIFDPTAGLDAEGLQKAPKSKNKALCQFTALLMRKFTYCIRKWFFLIIETVIPLILFMTVVHLTNDLVTPEDLKKTEYGTEHQTGGYLFPGDIPDNFFISSRSLSMGRSSKFKASDSESLKISLENYKSPITYYFDSENQKHLENVIGPSAKKSDFAKVSYKLLRIGRKDRISFKRRHIVAVEMTLFEITGYFNHYPYHSAPLVLNIISNTMLKSLAPNEKYRIHVENSPFHAYRDDISINQANDYDRRSPGSRASPRRNSFYFNPKRSYSGRNRTNTIESDPKPLVTLVSNLIPLGLLFLASNFIVMPIEERLCNAKQLQTMTGVNPMVYWGASFCFDYLHYLAVVFLLIIYLLVFEWGLGYGILSRGFGWPVLAFILVVYGFPATLLSYLFNFRSSSVMGGFTKVTLIHLLTGLFLGAMVPDYDNDFYIGGGRDTTAEEYGFFKFMFEVLHVIGRTFSTYSLVRALWNFAYVAAYNNNCRIVASNLAECVAKPYLVWEQKFLAVKVDWSGFTRTQRAEEIKVPRIGQELFWMIFMGIVYLGVLMFIEFKVWNMIFKPSGDPTAFPPNINDEDVFAEVERVNMLITGGGIGTECMIVHNLCKSFGEFAAVSQLHFGVHYGECFGLLGVNGAGKTTAFRMITGDERPSLGTAYGFGTSLDNNPIKFFSSIGYCPQFDGILPKFTGKEMLQLFAGLRGVPYKMRGLEAMRWLARFGLQDSANVRCGRYSGGMKRRLSTAMAMIGDPMLILLDEPTSGVDPVSRRQFWKILDKMRESGQSVILTSHSMEECEALCSRLAIMVNGQFQCFGGVQHLKNKFAQGYSLILKLKPDLEFGTPECDEQIAKFELTVMERFEPCTLKDKHQNLLQYHLENRQVTWDALFKSMEEIKTEFEALIEDYSVNETSLEEVFLAFARAQYPERRANVSMCKQVCTCSC